MVTARPISNTLPPAPRLVIAGWAFEEDRHCLVRDSELRRLEPKAASLLGYLARHAGQTLGREALLECVWPDVVVGDEALTTAINKIRRAFDDDRRHPTVIETIPKTGYRLIAPVSEVQPSEDMLHDAAAPAATDSAETARSSPAAVRIVIVGILLLVAAVAVFYLWPRPDATTTDASPAGEPALPRVSVQPFDVLGGEPEQQYLARGITADLITRLSRLPGLHVGAARAGPPAYAGADPQAGGNLYTVWGGVRRDGDAVEVEVHLVEVASGRQLWVERYARPFDDLFEIQQDVGTRLAKALSLRLSETELARIARRYTKSVAAYDLFLQAQSELLVRSASSNARAHDLYLQAVTLDPAFARAYGGLALIYAGDYRNQWTDDREHVLSQALKFANSANEIDPALPEVHWVLGYVKTQLRRHDEALAHLDQALALDPGFADALALKGGIQTYTGHPEQTVVLMRRAMRLNPAAGYLYFMTLGRAYFFLGDHEQALINLREALSRNPASLEVHVYLAAALQLAGDHDEADWQAEEIRVLKPGFTISAMLETYPLVDTRQLAALASTLGELGL